MGATGSSLVAGVVITCALAGCSSGGSTPPPPTPTTSSATASVTPSTDPVAEQILNSYRAFSSARVAALAKPTKKSLPKDLTKFGTGKAVSDVRATVLLFRQQGIELRGQPTLTPKVTAVDGASATITDCVDSSNWKPVYVATGKSAAASGQPTRVTATATAIRADARWLIKTVINERDRTC